jgi:5-methylcytosine-specific restriction enzyme A
MFSPGPDLDSPRRAPIQGQCASYARQDETTKPGDEPGFCVSKSMRKAKQFRPLGAPSRKEQKANADRWRGSASERGYNHRWAKARLTFIYRNPLCIGCLAMGRTVAARVVDHVDPHHGDPVKFWDTSMWQASCDWHHDSVKQRLEHMFDTGRATLADLWLNSPLAVRIALGMRCEEV